MILWEREKKWLDTSLCCISWWLLVSSFILLILNFYYDDYLSRILFRISFTKMLSFCWCCSTAHDVWLWRWSQCKSALAQCLILYRKLPIIILPNFSKPSVCRGVWWGNAHHCDTHHYPLHTLLISACTITTLTNSAFILLLSTC